MVQYQGIVACSGGPDSMALLAKLCDKKVIVAHVNYHKRDTADRDEQIVRNYCDQHHLPLFVYAPKQEKAGNFQSWARQVRYDFFVELALKYHIDTIYVAHQKDDLLETYFFQKQRHMLCETYGLKTESMYKGIRICRPLLGLGKRECMQYCLDHGIPFGIDESNLKDDYTRNQIRHSLVDTLSEDQKEEWLHTIEKENREWNTKREQISLFLDTWDRSVDSLPDWLFLEEWLFQFTQKRFSKKECMDLMKQLQSDTLIDLGDYDLESYHKKLYLQKKKKPVFIQLTSLKYGQYEGFSIEKTGRKIEGITLYPNDFPLTIRNVQAGDKIEMVWGTKKIHRIFIDRKIPRILRKNWLVVENSKKRIIFVPKIGCDVQHFSVKPNAFMIQ